MILPFRKSLYQLKTNAVITDYDGFTTSYSDIERRRRKPFPKLHTTGYRSMDDYQMCIRPPQNKTAIDAKCQKLFRSQSTPNLGHVGQKKKIVSLHRTKCDDQPLS